jgi:bacteriocin-like protein
MRKEKPSKQQPTISANSSIENKKETAQLTEEELKKISGGTLSDPEEGGQVRARQK